MNRLPLVIVFALAAFTSFAQDRPITAAERRQLGEIVPHLLDTMYVSPEKGKELAAKVQASFESGRYDAASTASALAAAINGDLASANDKHLGIHYTGKDSSAAMLTVDAWNARRAAMRSGQPMHRPQNQDARMVNYGVVSAQVLEGNVGYLKMREFMDSEEARTALSSAMAFLANTDAMIVDVRNCPGGSADTVSYLASYFFDSEKRVLMNRFNRPMNRRMDSTTVDVPGKRRPATDLYVLTGTTGSACESFAFTLQQWGRARTVGEKTSGAGNNNMFINLGGGFNFSISIGSAVHPKTGKAFEAVGVLPDIEVPASRALEAAHAEALQKLSRGAVRGDAIAEVRAVERERLDEYAGKYGVREVTVRDGALYFQRIGARGGVLKPIARDQFDLNGDVVITFKRDDKGAVNALGIQWKDGRTEVVPREP